MGDPKETYEYVKNIIEKLQENIEGLKNEQLIHKNDRKIRKGIQKNLDERVIDLRYYEELLREYVSRGYANKPEKQEDKKESKKGKFFKKGIF